MNPEIEQYDEPPPKITRKRGRPRGTIIPPEISAVDIISYSRKIYNQKYYYERNGNLLTKKKKLIKLLGEQSRTVIDEGDSLTEQIKKLELYKLITKQKTY